MNSVLIKFLNWNVHSIFCCFCLNLRECLSYLQYAVNKSVVEQV